LQQVFRSEETTQYLKDIGNGHFTEGLNFIEKLTCIHFNDTASKMQSSKVHEFNEGAYPSVKIGKSFIPRSFMLVPLCNRTKKKPSCSILLEFCCKKERRFTEDDEWICQNFSMKISSTL